MILQRRASTLGVPTCVENQAAERREISEEVEMSGAFGGRFPGGWSGSARGCGAAAVVRGAIARSVK